MRNQPRVISAVVNGYRAGKNPTGYAAENVTPLSFYTPGLGKALGGLYFDLQVAFGGMQSGMATVKNIEINRTMEGGCMIATYTATIEYVFGDNYDFDTFGPGGLQIRTVRGRSRSGGLGSWLHGLDHPGRNDPGPG